MRIVLLVEGGSCIVQDVRYAAAPETMARVLADVAYVLSQHGFDDEVGRMSRGVLRVTSGREPPGVQVVSGGGRRVVLLSPVMWERRAAAVEEGNEELGEALGEAANRGDWMVFVLSEEEGAGGRGADVEGGNATQDGNTGQGGNDGQDSNAGQDANDEQDSNAGQDANDGQGDHVSSSPRLDNPPPGSGANSPPASHGSSRGSSTPPPPPPSPPAPSIIVS